MNWLSAKAVVFATATKIKQWHKVWQKLQGDKRPALVDPLHYSLIISFIQPFSIGETFGTQIMGLGGGGWRHDFEHFLHIDFP